MELILTNNFDSCVYPKDIANAIKYNVAEGDVSEYTPARAYCIRKSSIPTYILPKIKNEISDYPAYIFIKSFDGRYIAIRVTMSAKTAANYAKAAKRYGVEKF